MQPFINTMLDPIVNFGKVTVSTGYNSTDTTPIVLSTGHGSKLPNPSTDGSFNLVWYDSSTYASASDDPNVEIVRCIARIEDELTIMRAQEGTSESNKNTPTSTYKMILSPTKKTITDIKEEYQSGVSTHSALSTGVHGVGGSTVESTSGSASKVSTHAGISTSVHGFDSLGDAPAQAHGVSRHSGNIGTEANITFSTIVGHTHTGSDSTKVDHINLNNKGTNTHTQIDTVLTASAGHIAANGTSVHGLGTMSTQTSNNVAITGGSITGITDLTVADGGTGRGDAVAYTPICGGTTSTGAHQSIASTGTLGQVLTSNGVGTLPTFQTISAGGSELLSNKNVANGYAGLDANVLLSAAMMYPIVEEYSNHLGAVDNFTITGGFSPGTAITDTTNHKMDLSTVTTGGVQFETKKTWNLGTKPVIVNFIVQNIVNGTGTNLTTWLGLYNTRNQVNLGVAMFRQIGNFSWECHTRLNSPTGTTTAITSLANGDMVTIYATSSVVMYFVNGILVATHTTIPNQALKVGTFVADNSGMSTTARIIGIDMMSIKVYK